MQRISYDRHRFPPEVIRHAIWLYLRFTLSYRDVEELLIERGRGLLRNGPALGPQVRTELRPQPATAATSSGRHLALGRDGGLDSGPAHVSVARRRQRRRDPRSLGPAAARQGSRPSTHARFAGGGARDRDWDGAADR